MCDVCSVALCWLQYVYVFMCICVSVCDHAVDFCVIYALFSVPAAIRVCVCGCDRLVDLCVVYALLLCAVCAAL